MGGARRAMSETIDVNILVYASNTEASEHDRAVALVGHLSAGPGLVVLFWPTIFGYLRLATHPSVFATPLSPEVAMANLESLLERPHIRTAGEGDNFWSIYRRVAAEVSPRGNLVPDAQLATLMVEHGVSTIWSRDRDLRKFDGIKALDPFADRYADGFGRAR